MKITYKDQARILSAKENELICVNCGENNWKKLIYCEQDSKLYCFVCHLEGNGCKGKTEHMDIKIDEVVIIEE